MDKTLDKNLKKVSQPANDDDLDFGLDLDGDNDLPSKRRAKPPPASNRKEVIKNETNRRSDDNKSTTLAF